MSDATRRGFLVFAGAGTAAAVGAVAAPKLFGEQDAGSADSTTQLQAADLAGAESFVVHVKDVRTGQLAILVGEREVLVTDRELAARLAGATTA
ncbi:twin-arginine translocation signal domain-containing protein [Kribbella sp. NPDC051952]|uniref:twin-arginine translocation signal domain-containing protein n=1 Tax=Kribbella sp. NPDC051952 TaxID=3154851 RepID=UPI00342203BD